MSRKPQDRTASQILDKYELNEVDKAILKYRVQYPAMSDQDLSEILGVDRKLICRRTAKPQWKAAFSEYFLPPKEYVESQGMKLARRYIALAYSKDEKIAERVIRTILTSIGVLKVDALNIENFDPMIIKFEDSKEAFTVVNSKTVQEIPKIETPPNAV